MAYKLVVAVRGDLRMSVGKTAAQVAHAAVTAALSEAMSSGARSEAGTTSLEAWLQDGQPKVVVRVLGEQALRDLVDQAEAVGVRATPIADAGRTELEPGTITCCAFGPDADDDVDAVTGHLPLF